MSFRLTVSFLLLLISFLVIGCSGGKEDEGINIGGGNGGDWDIGGGEGGGLGSGDSGGSGGSSGPGLSTLTQNLDCTDLDPDKVYIYGGAFNKPVGSSVSYSATWSIATPERVSDFCASFGSYDASVDDRLAISPSGRVLYTDYSFDSFNYDIFMMEPDDVYVDSDGDYVYRAPGHLSNDELVSLNPGSDKPRRMVIDMSDVEEVFYQYESPLDDIISSASDGVHYVPPGERYLIGSLEDGSLLLFNTNDGVIRLSSGLVETVVVPPVAGPYIFFGGEAKHAPDGTVWIPVARFGETIRRWRFDPADNSIVNEGEFAALPADTSSSVGYKPVIDGNGNLWQLSVLEIDGETYEGVVKRPIDSSGEPSIGYHEISDIEGVSIRVQQLVTGP